MTSEMRSRKKRTTASASQGQQDIRMFLCNQPSTNTFVSGTRKKPNTVLLKKISEIKSTRHCGWDVAVREYFNSINLANDFSRNSWSDAKRKLLDNVRNGYFSSTSASKFQKVWESKSDVTFYIADLYSTLVNKDGSEVNSPLVPQVAEEMASLLRSCLAVPGILPCSNNVRKLLLLLRRDDLRDERLLHEKIWIFLFRLLETYVPYDRQSRIYWICILSDNALEEDACSNDNVLIESFRKSITNAFSSSENSLKRWFWVSLLERDMCAAHLASRSFKVPSLAVTPLAFFISCDVNRRSRNECLISERSLKTMSQWVLDIADWADAVNNFFKELYIASQVASTQDCSVLQDLDACISLISVTFEAVRFTRLIKHGDISTKKDCVPEELKDSLRNLVRFSFKKEPLFEKIAGLFEIPWMQRVVVETLAE